MLKKIIIVTTLLGVCVTQVSATTTELNYKATFGIFGTVGTIKNRLTQNKSTYEIHTTVKMAGLAKMIMGGQTEHYTSKGHMQNGLMVSDFYEMISTKKEKKTSKMYLINHQHKSVIKRYRKWIKGKLVVDKKQKLAFYAKDDLLTLYFNLGNAISEKGKTYLFKAVGLEKQKGKVRITVPSEGQDKAYIKDLGTGAALYAKALIYQENFRKKKGDILLAVAKDGFIRKSVIKDVLLYGDAKLTRTK